MMSKMAVETIFMVWFFLKVEYKIYLDSVINYNRYSSLAILFFRAIKFPFWKEGVDFDAQQIERRGS